MVTPYDWQEGIGNRAQYVESRLTQGMPVIAFSLKEGILLYTRRRQARKIFEIYDRLAYAAIGQQSDLETLRMAAIDFAHQEGFNRSEEDVTLQRVVTALSAPVKRSFSDFTAAPVVARSVFVEIGDKLEDDRFAILDYDGDYQIRGSWGYVAGESEVGMQIHDGLAALKPAKLNVETAITAINDLWERSVPDERRPTALRPEVALLQRSADTVNRFRLLTPES